MSTCRSYLRKKHGERPARVWTTFRWAVRREICIPSGDNGSAWPSSNVKRSADRPADSTDKAIVETVDAPLEEDQSLVSACA